ncbi:hypothetical protein M408DRAFT_330409 [Serendipita vermifera MAFF 305830]|uniref:Uncharacterized protein n=1 Tax=Serendipita vermifera MAFF 305830 TaxID=933852 RepID=A0A0C3B5Q9_SERVB|nr:hypothetical protein M408DRAFT_330409 [Serendipita vermifera MAFF 305830]
MSGVELLEGDMNMLGVVLKLMVDPPAPVSDSQLFGSRDISFRVSPGGSSGKLASPSTREDVVELASRLGVISPDKRWRWILGQLELKVL